jgi:monoamine oxidase
MQRMQSLTIKGHVAVPPVKITRSRWGSDPYSRGAYSYNAIGHRRGSKCSFISLPVICVMTKNYPGLRKELGRKEGRIWFAGEAVNESSLWHSCVHGAWHSGVNAAVDVSREFGIPVEIPYDFGLAPKY